MVVFEYLRICSCDKFPTNIVCGLCVCLSPCNHKSQTWLPKYASQNNILTYMLFGIVSFGGMFATSESGNS